jgi:hypothetical protein
VAEYARHRTRSHSELLQVADKAADFAFSTKNLAPFGRTCSRIHLNPVHPVNPVKKIRQDNRIKQDTSHVNQWFQHKKNANSYTIKLNHSPNF